jgi:hypothetical protein
MVWKQSDAEPVYGRMDASLSVLQWSLRLRDHDPERSAALYASASSFETSRRRYDLGRSALPNAATEASAIRAASRQRQEREEPRSFLRGFIASQLRALIG